jgi:proteic killer suppression protein
MIISFLHVGLENFFLDKMKKGINPQHAKKLERILERLDSAEIIDDMRYPGSDLHLLEPRNEQRWAVKVDKSWRVTFVFKEGDVYEADYVNYH